MTTPVTNYAANLYQNTSGEFKAADAMLKLKGADPSILMMAVGMAGYKSSEAALVNDLKSMNAQNARMELANQAKALEDKLKAFAKNKNLGDTDKLNKKADDWTKEGKNLAAELAVAYGKLGINGSDITKLGTGDFTLKDLEAMGTATKGVTDAAQSANQMTNLSVSQKNNSLQQWMNLATKALETLKAVMGNIINGMGR